MKIKNIILVSLFFTQLNCGKINRTYYDFYFQGSDETFARAQVAVQTWNQVCNTHLTVSKTHGQVSMIETDQEYVYKSKDFEHKNKCNGVQSNDFYGWPKNIILKKNATTITIEHEIGHVLGLSHLPTGVMSKYEYPDTRQVSNYECDILNNTEAYEQSGYKGTE